MTHEPKSYTPVDFEVPPGACDCHTHIHAPQFPYSAGRMYTPGPATPEEMTALHKELGIQRVVVVQSSVYGTDYSAALTGIAARGPDARGVAVIGEKTTEAELDRLHAAGVRGIRLNLAAADVRDPNVARERLQKGVARVKGRNWHVEVYTMLALVTAIKQIVLDSPVPISFDHFANAKEGLGLDQPGFSDFVDLVTSGQAYVKLSIPGDQRNDYSCFVPLAQTLISANSDRCVWGTNWPHPNATGGRLKPMEVTPLHQVDDGLVLNQLKLWVPDMTVSKKILVDNPGRLYDF